MMYNNCRKTSRQSFLKPRTTIMLVRVLVILFICFLLTFLLEPLLHSFSYSSDKLFNTIKLLQAIMIILCIGLIYVLVVQYAVYKNKTVVLRIYTAVFLLLITGAIVVYIMSSNPFEWENYNPDFGGLFGGLLSGVATLFVILFSLSIEKRRSYEQARTSALFLASILKSISDQIMRLWNGSREPIEYPENWMQYYYNAFQLTEYDYLDGLNREFDYVRRLNVFLGTGDY